MNNIFITNDVISEKNLRTSQTTQQPPNPNQGALPNAQLPQNILEMVKLLEAMRVPRENINALNIINQQDDVKNLLKAQLLIAFPQIAQVFNYEELMKYVTAGIYQWANTVVPKTPKKA